MITIEQCQIIITNLSNFVAVKTNNRDASFWVKVNRSVARLPIDALLNSDTHFGFDLTHERKERKDGEREKTGSVGRVGVDGPQVSNATDQGVVSRCFLVSVVVVLILAESGIDQVPLIRGEEVANGQEVGACCHVVV